MKKNSFVLVVCAFSWFFQAFFGFGQTNFVSAQELFMQNKPREALGYLEKCVAENPADAQAFLYLGIVYEQLNRPDEAIAAYRKILGNAGTLTANVAANLGNAYFLKGNTDYAEQYYSRALDENEAYSSAYLGRANTRVRSGALGQAVLDYEVYLLLEPGSPKRSQIERLIAFIRAEFAAEERRKLLAEEEARAEAERRRKLLEEVAASLQTAADASQGLSTGAENVETYDGEFELE